MIDAETMDQVRQQLASRAELFEDPRSYLDGVHDALDRIQELGEPRDGTTASERDPLRLVEVEDVGDGLPHAPGAVG